uniref:Rho GTPase activating protein 27 n=1 Tax=Ursus maritimus TaxID=29073 RepID=A0A452UJ02_URSMA
MQPSLSPLSPRDQRPPTPEMDYPESLTSYPEEDYSPVGSFSEPRSTSPLATPPGWSCQVSPDGQTLYTNHFTQEQWVRLEDQHGKPYFYNPDDASVQWELPQVPVPAPRSIHKSSQDSETPAQASPPEEKVREGAWLGEVGSWEEISPAGVKIKTLDKAGVLHRTKTVDKGKRLRKKHWSASWTVLEGGVLTFFKDSKASAAGGLRQPPKLSTPEYTVDLRGASLSWAPKDKSSRKNVLELRSRDGSEYLIQHDSEAIISTWYKAIGEGIQELSADLPPEEESESSSADFGSSERLGSWREDEAGNPSRSFRPVPRSPRSAPPPAAGLDIDGLYRISGNLATIQKLRYKVDHDERLDLDDGRWEDVHVITGALKLYFRELPEPLFPFSHFRQFIAAISERLGELWALIPPSPLPGRRVIEHGDQNRMSVQSVAIVFGPTLLRPETEETSMPMTMVFQNQVVELILQRCSDIFPPH